MGITKDQHRDSLDSLVEVLKQPWYMKQATVKADYEKSEIVVYGPIVVWDNAIWGGARRRKIAAAHNTRHPDWPRAQLKVVSMGTATLTHFGADEEVVRYKVKFIKPKEEATLAGIVLGAIAANIPRGIGVQRFDSKKRGASLLITMKWGVDFDLRIEGAYVKAKCTINKSYDNIVIGDLHKDSPELISKRVNELVRIMSGPHAFIQAQLQEVK